MYVDIYYLCIYVHIFNRYKSTSVLKCKFINFIIKFFCVKGYNDIQLIRSGVSERVQIFFEKLFIKPIK